MKYRIIKVTEWKNIYYKIQYKFLFMWFDECDWVYWFVYSYKTLENAEKILNKRYNFKNTKEEIIKYYK